MTCERLSVHVLGRFRLISNGSPLAIRPRLRKPQELLQALIAFGGTEVGASTLIDALWPESEGDAAYHALESAIYRLRRLLGAPDVVSMMGGKVSLNPNRLWVDIWEFASELRRAHVSHSPNAQWLTRLRALYQGAFLQHETDRPWVLQARQELCDRSLNVIREVAYEQELARHWQDAAHLYQFGIELDCLNESLYRALMRCHQELGNHSEALQAYRRCRDLLNRCLGVMPNARTESLHLSVRARAASVFNAEGHINLEAAAN